MFKNLVIFLMLLFVSVQIAWSKPDRVISLSPTATEMLFAIGAGGNAVAVDSYSNFPKDAPLTNLSALESNLEAIASCELDLVIIAFEIRNLKVDLNAVGIEVLMLPATPTLEDTLKQILEVGDITGNEENTEKLVVKIRSQVKTISSQREGTRKFSVYHELDENYFRPLTRSFLGNINDILGFKNIADEADTAKMGYPKRSAEYIMVSNPDIIVTSGLKNDKQLKFALRAGWNASKAIQNEG